MGEIQPLDDKIRQLCERLSAASEDEVAVLAGELRAALHEHAEHVRLMLRQVLSKAVD